MRAFIFALLLTGTVWAAEKPEPAAQPIQFVIGISPFLDNGVKDEVYRSLVRLLVQDLPLNSTVAVYDAFDLKSVAKVNVPNSHVFDSPKTRANQFAGAIHDLKQFLAQPHPKPSVARLNFDGAIRLPQFCDFLAENLPGGTTPLRLLLIGSPLYQDEKEPGFSMVDDYFPSDGHLQATRDQSVFGTKDAVASVRPLLVHWVYFGDPWANDLYKEKITRFWTLYLARRDATLITFCGDLPTGVQAFRQDQTDSSVAAHHWSIEPQQTKIEMLRIGREVELADWIQRDSVRDNPTRPPLVMLGPMKIGIRWKDNIDLDLYAAPHSGAETLFFQHPRSPEGYYYKDHRDSPGREFEFIEFESPVDIRLVEAFVNFYKGSCPDGPRGEVRIEFDGRIYSSRFSIPASNGNRGRAGSTQQEFWTRIPVQEILKLNQTASAN